MKSWQIFVFTLIPLALVFAGVIAGSLDGSDSEREVFPTPEPGSLAPLPASRQLLAVMPHEQRAGRAAVAPGNVTPAAPAAAAFTEPAGSVLTPLTPATLPPV
jgi:hypothetical protein